MILATAHTTLEVVLFHVIMVMVTLAGGVHLGRWLERTGR
jgi:hypothetical protein